MGSQWVRFPRLFGTMRALRRLPVRFASFRFLTQRYHLLPTSLPFAPAGVRTLPPAGLGFLFTGDPVRLPKAWKQRDLPGSWMTLTPHLPCSWTPVEPMCQAITAHRYCPRNRYDEGLGKYNLSRLDHTAFAAASYASCRAHPTATQGWLLAAGQLYQVGLVSHWVMQEGFEVLLSFFLLLQAYPGAKRLVICASFAFW